MDFLSNTARPRPTKTHKVMQQEFPQPSAEEIRSEMRIDAGVSEEEFLLRYALGDEVDGNF